MKSGMFGGIKVNDFKNDLEYSLDSTEDKLFNEFYFKAFPNLREIEVCNDMERQRKGIDKILHFNNGNWFSIDEKKRRSDYGDILLEIWSVDKKKRGWLFTCQCDYIVYAIMPSLKVYLLPTILLKKAWVTNSEKWIQYTPKIAENKGYVTESRAIKVDELLSAIANEMSNYLLLLPIEK
jgi:hypothetical protein